LAQEEARALAHNHIGTEHILLGLLREDHGLGARVLVESFDITLERVRQEVVRADGLGQEAAGQAPIPFTRPAKEVFALALREAVELSHNYIGTEHILLALSRQNQGTARRIMIDCLADPKKVREAVLALTD
jgi:ATP-dependent Clp protease ATP-binding subunit ClpC